MWHLQFNGIINPPSEPRGDAKNKHQKKDPRTEVKLCYHNRVIKSSIFLNFLKGSLRSYIYIIYNNVDITIKKADSAKLSALFSPKLAAAAAGIVAVVAATAAGQQENEDDDPSAVVSAESVTHIVSPLSCSQHHSMEKLYIWLQKILNTLTGGIGHNKFHRGQKI